MERRNIFLRVLSAKSGLSLFFIRITGRNLHRVLPVIIGAGSLIWFLIRVIPKPSRATYPCQRAAFPLASSFIIWLTGGLGLAVLRKNVRTQYIKNLFKIRLVYPILAITIILIISFSANIGDISANRQPAFRIQLIDNVTENIVEPAATVSIIRSRKSNASDIDSAEICDMIRSAVDMAGGFDTLIHDNTVVVLKPNLLTPSVVDDNLNPIRDLSPEVNGVTTDYRVIQAVVNLVRERNPHGKVYIMEGSAVGKVRDNMQKMGWLNIQGVDEFICLDEACGAWRDQNASELVKVSLLTDQALYTSAGNVYYLNKIYYTADVVISIPVLKTHSNTAVTGAVKNVGIGATPVNIYGYSTSRPYRFEVIDHGSDASKYENLHRWIHDFYLCRPVDYAIMDALTGMQSGPCPFSSIPDAFKLKNTRCIMVSKDAIALDAIESLIVQVDPSKVHHLVTLHNDGKGCADPKLIRVKGLRVDQVKDHYSTLTQYASYSDFTAPEFSIDSYSISDSISGTWLSLNLETDDQVEKVEIAYDDTLLNQIITGNFNNIAVNLHRKPVSDLRKIKIFAYDHYLNCSILYLDGSPASLTVKNLTFTFQVYPNPVRNVANVKIHELHSENSWLSIYNTAGVLQLKIHLIRSDLPMLKQLDLSHLTEGLYTIVIESGRYKQQIKILKE